MADIKALSILDIEIEEFKKFPWAPRELKSVDQYTKSIQKLSDNAATSVDKVRDYIENVEDKLTELRNNQKQFIRNNQDAIKKILETIAARFQESEGIRSNPPEIATTSKPAIGNVNDNDPVVKATKKNKEDESDYNLENLKIAHALEKATQDLQNSKLNKLIQETEKACEKAKRKGLTKQDAIALLGCVNSWKDAKAEEQRKQKEKEEAERKAADDKRKKIAAQQQSKRDAEQKRRDEEQRKRDAEQRKREEDQRRKEEEDIRKREEEQRKRDEDQRKRDEELRKKEEQEEKRREAEQRQIEEEQKRQDEERRKKEEEEQMRRVEEERVRREQEENAKREAEEKSQKAEEEQKRKDEERKKRQEEAERKLMIRQKQREEERKAAEKRQKEAEERAWRRDPENWSSFVYNRSCDEVDDNLDYHKGIGCVLTSTPDSLSKDEIECSASDEIDTVIDILEEHETPLSSVIEVKSKDESSLRTEVPFRIYIPYSSVLNASEEVVIKSSEDHDKWKVTTSLHPTDAMKEDETMNYVLGRMVGYEANDCSNVKLLVVARPKTQAIAVDYPGVSVNSSFDRNVKLFVPRDAFPNRTYIQMMTQPTMSENIHGNSTFESVTRASCLVTLMPQQPSNLPMEVDFIKNKQDTGRQIRAKTFQVCRTGHQSWKFADVENKGQHGDVSVNIPAGKEHYATMEIEVPPDFPREHILGIVEEIQASVNKTTVVMIVKQSVDRPNDCTVRIVRQKELGITLKALEETGYTEGPDVSGEFKIKEGQYLKLSCSGNIAIEEPLNETIILPYMSYRGGVRSDIKIGVNEYWKQKDLPSYVGKLSCHLLRDRSGNVDSFTEVTLTIPKGPRSRVTIETVKLQFPYYLTVLVNYLSSEMFNDASFDWQALLKSLMGDREFDTRCRIARRKFAEDDLRNVCQTALLDWMKAKPISVDKVSPIVNILRKHGEVDMADNCEAIVQYMKEHLSDKVLKQLAQTSTKDVQTLGRDLGLTSNIVAQCEGPHPGSVEALLIKWRETDLVLPHWANAFDYLQTVV